VQRLVWWALIERCALHRANASQRVRPVLRRQDGVVGVGTPDEAWPKNLDEVSLQIRRLFRSGRKPGDMASRQLVVDLVTGCGSAEPAVDELPDPLVKDGGLAISREVLTQARALPSGVTDVQQLPLRAPYGVDTWRVGEPVELLALEQDRLAESLEGATLPEPVHPSG
jgi:hypothetical protein